LAFGTVLIGVGQGFAGGGSASASYAMLYVWVALYAAMYFGRRVVAAQLAWTVATHMSALVFLGDLDAVLPRIALTLGTQIAASVVVGRMARHLRSLADTDPLTGLANRRSASRALARAVSAPQRRGRRLAVALIDLDGFKALNDTRGHAAGDAVLTDAAHAWSAAIEPGWTLARTGGDEFLIIAPHTRSRTLDLAVQRLRRATPQVQFSVGLTYWDGIEPPTSLVQRADRALYAAKDIGRCEVKADRIRSNSVGGVPCCPVRHQSADGRVPLGSGADAVSRAVEA
jgi:diguanylate cyclase (GGDEF)-like protein